ncbi:MAG: ABC transporter ATP-binding protein [Desulfobacterales bacterium]|nr:ABC transporter ATP-binding protein [Desulfobacterales bacterium]
MLGCDKDRSEITPESTPPSRAFIRVDRVSKRFGQIEAVSQVSFPVAKGSIFGLVGSDGAGKSTLLRMVATMVMPSEGSILIDGLDVVSQKAKVKSIIGYVPQRFGLYSDLTVGENLNFFMDVFGIFGRERQQRRERYLRFSNLLPFVDRLAGNLSGGMKQKLGLACVLVHQPQVLILDEPTNGVDPLSRQEFWDILFDMKRQGITILVSTAYMDEGEKCDHLALMHRSQVLDTATPTDIRAHFPSLEEAMIHRIQQVDEALIHDRFKR